MCPEDDAIVSTAESYVDFNVALYVQTAEELYTIKTFANCMSPSIKEGDVEQNLEALNGSTVKADVDGTLDGALTTVRLSVKE